MLARALRHEGCPICRLSRGADFRWLFHFLYEGHRTPKTADQFCHDFGFCGDHAAQSLRLGAYSLTEAIIYRRLVGRTLRLFAEFDEPAGRGRWRTAATAGCIACRVQEETDERQAFFLARYLEAEGFESYARPGALCVWHLPALAGHIADRLMPDLLNAHAVFLDEAASHLHAANFPGGRAAGDRDVDSRVEDWIERVAGPRSFRVEWIDDAADNELVRDDAPVRRMRRAIGNPSACPVCAQVKAAWQTWVTWLDEAAGRGKAIEDVLPLCRRHVREVLRHGGGDLRLGVARHLVRTARQDIAFAQRGFAAQPKKGALLPTAARRLWDRSRAPGRARSSLNREPRCPICQRLASARDRALDLVAALLEEEPSRRAFEGGYGLCVRHTLRALDRLPETESAATIASVARARLAVLEWELEEQVRKASWSTRPEGSGAEAGAWSRAARRFSGWVPEDGR